MLYQSIYKEENMKRKSLAILTVTALTCGIISGCGGSTQTATSAAASAESTAAETSAAESGASETAKSAETSAAASSSWKPEKDLSAIVYWGAGGTTDTCVRGVINSIPEGELEKNIIVSNVAGGSGLVGFQQFMSADADGYTIGVYNCDMVLNYVLGNTDIDSSKIVPLACIEQDPYLLIVKKDAPYDTFEEFVDYCKEHPGEVSIGDTGSGAVPHLVYTALNKGLGLETSTVAYDSSGDSVIAVVSGECTATVAAPGVAKGQLDAGEVKALACSGQKRLDAYPDVPCMSELYDEISDMNILSWITVCVKEGTPDGAVSYLQKIFQDGAASDSYKETLQGFGFQSVPAMDHDEMLKFVADQQAYYESVAK